MHVGLQSSSVRRSSRRHPFRRLRARLYALARVLAVVVAAQLAGVAHHAIDVVFASQGAILHDGKSGCAHDEQGDECPPGCPDCHGTHRLAATPPIAVEGLQRVHDGSESLVRPRELEAPTGTRTAVYRPPRRVPSLT